jgi:sec-independent protein translocase protein TatA
MGGFSIWHWLIVGIIVLLLFGKGRFSDMMGDVAKGLKSFKKGMTEEDEPPAAQVPPRRITDDRTAETPPAVTPAAAPAPVAEDRREV